MSHMLVIQTAKTMESRMADQLRGRKVDTGLYAIGGERAAQAWSQLDDKYPLPWDITQGLLGQHYGGERCVIDLGPGSGRPCLAAIRSRLGQFREIVLVDVSSAMLSIAQEYLQRNTQAVVSSIIADFLRDAEALGAALTGFAQPRLFLCLGQTVGNFNQHYALCTLRSFLGEGEHVLLDFGLYPRERSGDFLKDLANLYAQGAYHFGQHSLAACGAAVAHQHLSLSVGQDDDDREVQVIRVFYRIPEDIVLTAGRETVAFKKGEQLQIHESRRFLANRLECHLKKYGLGVVTSQYFESRGVFLCRRVQRQVQGPAWGLGREAFPLQRKVQRQR
jgi:SAM-dependent methyltransferase